MTTQCDIGSVPDVSFSDVQYVRWFTTIAPVVVDNEPYRVHPFECIDTFVLIGVSSVSVRHMDRQLALRFLPGIPPEKMRRGGPVHLGISQWAHLFIKMGYRTWYLPKREV